MFTDCSVFILATDGKIYRLVVDRDSQITICATFASSVQTMINKKTLCEYDVNYKPEDDELLCIKDFQLQEEIKEAIRKPLETSVYRKKQGKTVNANEDNLGFPDIKAIFVGDCTLDNKGEHFRVAFQKYRKEQNLVTIPFRLFHSGNTFKQERHFGIGITSNIDCYYADQGLLFNSFYFARQVFDLREYLRLATDQDVLTFTSNKALQFEDDKSFNNMVNSYVRRKIAVINDSGILKNYTAKRIKSIAKKSGIDIKVDDKKIVIPADKDAALEVLAFLDEEAYRGPFSNDLLIANSKRVLRKA